MRIPRLHKEVSLFSPQTIAATFSRLADSITSIVAGNATYTDPDGVVRESQIGTMVRQTVDNVIIKATATATTAAQGGQSIIQSLINVAPEGVRISAEKVDIEGAAIFTTGKLSKVVTSSQTEWYSSTSATAKSDGSWSTTQPSVVAGRYVWERQKLTYSDGKSEYKPSAEGVCTQGQTDLSSYSTTDRMEGAIGTAKSDAISAANSATDTKLQSVNTAIANVRATADAAAPKANAVKRTQRIYYRSDSATKPATPSAWVTKEDDGTGAWTKMHVAITSTHKYIYTCEQSEKADGTLGHTTVLRDNTITVIDGGNVITHSIVADKLDADSVKANIVQTTDLSASKITSGDIATERMSANIVKAVKAKVSDLYALVAKIGGFVINATSIFSGTGVTSNADNSIALSTEDFTRTINSTSRAGLRFAIGDKFGVTGDGTLYAHGANIVGINADNISSGSINADRIKANVISAVNNGTGTINADKVNVSAIKIGDLDGASTVVSNASNGKSAYDRHTAYRGTCSTAAGTAAKVVPCTGFALATGATVEVYCSTANTADVPTLNVNSTGNKPIWINGAVASASNPCKWLAGDTVTFTYDGTRFRASLPVEGYVTEGTGGGLMVHRKSDATTGVQITDSVEILQNGTSVAEYGATARIGEANGNHVSIDSNAVSIMDGTDALARFGSSAVIGQPRVADNMVIYLGKDAGSNEGITEIVRWVDDSSLARYLTAIHDRINGNDYVVIGDANGTYPEHGFLSVSLGSHTVEGTGPTGDYAIAEGRNNASSGKASHAEGEGTKASAPWSHAQNVGTIAASNSQTAIGAYNIEDSNGVYAFIIGSGASDTARSNALTVDWNGNLVIAGGITLSTPLADSNLPTMGSADMAGTSDATSGATLAVPYITTDAYGRVTAKGTHTHTIGSLAAGAVTSGTFNAARIPNLNASKITAGTLNSARLPTVPVNKGGTGQTGVTTVTDVASFIAAASGVTINSVRVTVWGKLVHAYVTAKPDAAKTSAWVVGTVVDAYRPNAVVTGKPYYTGVDSARIMTDGTMQITACGAHEVGVSFTYLLA